MSYENEITFVSYDEELHGCEMTIEEIFRWDQYCEGYGVIWESNWDEFLVYG